MAPNRRARFWAASPPASPPTSREVRWKREAHIYGRRTHLKRRPPRRARGQARHDGGTLNATRSAGRGWESQGQSLDERERTSQRRRAKGQRPNWDKRGLLSHDGLWRGGEAFAVRLGAQKNPFSFHFHFAVQPLRNHKTTKKPPPKHHTPRSACGLSFKGTSLGLRLDLTQVGIPLAKRARRGGYAGCGSRVGKRRVNFHGARNRAPPDPTAASRRGRGDSFTFNLQTLASYCGRPGPWWFRFPLVSRRRGGPLP